MQWKRGRLLRVSCLIAIVFASLLISKSFHGLPEYERVIASAKEIAVSSSHIITTSRTPASNDGTHSTRHHCPENETLSPYMQLLTIDHFGQLGNNMFQYAGLLGVANFNGRTPFIAPKSLLARVFRISHLQNVPNSNKWKHIGEPSYGTYDESYECLPKGPLLLQCYFQSFKYFKDIHHEIRNEFTFVPNFERSAVDMMERLTRNSTASTKIGVHIRRGDKLTQKEIRSGEQVAPASYFRQAFQWMRDRYTNVVFLVATDDMKWTKSNVGGSDVVFLPPATGPVHLNILSKCDHVIMSVGTFGWWAGWLADGDVIYYNKPLRSDSWKGQRFKMEDFYPQKWIGLGD